MLSALRILTLYRELAMPYKDPQSKAAKLSAKNTSKRWQQNNPEKYRRVVQNSNLKKSFGITLIEYEAMCKEQKGLCAICQKPEKHLDRKGGRVLNLAVDHDHSTNKVRQLLCMDCNKGIGCFGDDILRLLAAIEYIKKHSRI